MGVLHLRPLEPVLLSFVVTYARPAVGRSDQGALEVAPSFVRFDRRERRALTSEPLDRRERADRSLEPRRTHLEVVGPGHRLIHIETIREPAAEPRAVRHADAAG